MTMDNLHTDAHQVRNKLMITTSSNYGKILNFQIDKYVPWLSDHCPLHTTIDTNPWYLKFVTPKLNTRKPNFIWNERYKDTLNANLASANIKTKLESLLISEDLEPTHFVQEVKNTLLFMVDKCKVKRSKPQNENDSQP